MIPKQSDNIHLEKSPRNILLTPRLFMAIQQGLPADWDSLWQEFRLHLQSRMASMASDHDLHKLQGKLEFVNELESFVDLIVRHKGE